MIKRMRLRMDVGAILAQINFFTAFVSLPMKLTHLSKEKKPESL